MNVNPVDRWGSTPLNGAIKYPRIASIPKSKGAVIGKQADYNAYKLVEMSMD